MGKRNNIRRGKTMPKPPKSVTKSDDEIWNLPGFNKYEFYAASEYFRSEKNQNQGLGPTDHTYSSTRSTTGHVAGKLRQDMLDHLALLFAKVKTTTAIPPKHVTATALKKVGTNLEIWIAKNDEPDDPDQKFKSDLQLWFNKKRRLGERRWFDANSDSGVLERSPGTLRQNL
jgi:hypothetical protein